MKSFDEFINESSYLEINKWLKFHKVHNYRIVNNIINVDGNVVLRENYEENNTLPYKFGNVTGDFVCKRKRLRSLFNCPDVVGGYFSCIHNPLIDLKNGPASVGGGYYAFECGLKSLSGIAQRIGGKLDISKNKLTSLEGCPKNITNVFNCTYNNLKNLEGGPETVDAYYCFGNELETLDNLPYLHPNKVNYMDINNKKYLQEHDIIIKKIEQPPLSGSTTPTYEYKRIKKKKNMQIQNLSTEEINRYWENNFRKHPDHLLYFINSKVNLFKMFGADANELRKKFPEIVVAEEDFGIFSE